MKEKGREGVRVGGREGVRAGGREGHLKIVVSISFKSWWTRQLKESLFEILKLRSTLLSECNVYIGLTD